MKVSINGQDVELTDGLTVTAMLVDQKVKWADMVAVELNGEILDRATFATTVVKTGDKIEFLYFMGGGAAVPSLGNRPAEIFQTLENPTVTLSNPWKT